MFSLGVILYIMLTGAHPFDETGQATEDQIEDLIRSGTFPLRDAAMTRHISDSAIDLIEGLMNPNPKERLTADDILTHPWVTGETASTDIIRGSDRRLRKFRVYKSRLQAKFFRDVVEWSDRGGADDNETRRKTSLVERSFLAFDGTGRGELTASDLSQSLGAAGGERATTAAGSDDGGGREGGTGEGGTGAGNAGGGGGEGGRLSLHVRI